MTLPEFEYEIICPSRLAEEIVRKPDDEEPKRSKTKEAMKERLHQLKLRHRLWWQ